MISYAASSALGKADRTGHSRRYLYFGRSRLDELPRRAGASTARKTRGRIYSAIVLASIAPQSSSVSLKIEKDFALAAALGDGRLAIADVQSSVPAGKYAAAALQKLGVWAAVKPKLAPANDVRAALALVAQGQSPLGIVYETDAAAEPKVKVVGVFPYDTHPPIIYPIAVTAAAKSSDAARRSSAT